MTPEQRATIRATMDNLQAKFRRRRLDGALPEELNAIFREHSELFGGLMRSYDPESKTADAMDGLVGAVGRL